MLIAATELIDDLLWQTPPREGDFAPWLWPGMSVGLLLLGIVALMLRRRHQGRAMAKAGEAVSAHVTALAQLQGAKGLLRDDRAREFVIVVSRILRTYLAGRFDIRASHRASEEFLRDVSLGKLLTPEQEVLLVHFLSRCDRVKFARGRVTQDEMEELFDASHRFILETVPTGPQEEALQSA